MMFNSVFSEFVFINTVQIVVFPLLMYTGLIALNIVFT